MCESTSCTFVSTISLAGTVAGVTSIRDALTPDEAGATRKATLTIADADGPSPSLHATIATIGTSMRARAASERG